MGSRRGQRALQAGAGTRRSGGLCGRCCAAGVGRSGRGALGALGRLGALGGRFMVGSSGGQRRGSGVGRRGTLVGCEAVAQNVPNYALVWVVSDLAH